MSDGLKSCPMSQNKTKHGTTGRELYVDITIHSDVGSALWTLCGCKDNINISRVGVLCYTMQIPPLCQSPTCTLYYTCILCWLHMSNNLVPTTKNTQFVLTKT